MTTPEDLDEDQYMALLRADLNGEENATAFLEQDLDEWYQSLVALNQDIDAQFSKRRAEADSFQTDSQRRGGSRQEWFAYKAEYETWRGSASHLKKKVLARLREVKEMRTERNRDNSKNEEIRPMLREIIERLDRIEKILR